MSQALENAKKLYMRVYRMGRYRKCCSSIWGNTKALPQQAPACRQTLIQQGTPRRKENTSEDNEKAGI